MEMCSESVGGGPCTELCALAYPHPTTSLSVKMIYHPHFTDEEAEAQRYEGLRPRNPERWRFNSQAVPGVDQEGLKTDPSDSRDLGTLAQSSTRALLSLHGAHDPG